MRWESKTKYNDGDVRLVNKFCFFPLKLYKKHRWLESAWIIQMYLPKWKNVMFISDEILDDVKELFEEGKGKQVFSALHDKENNYTPYQSEDILKKLKIK